MDTRRWFWMENGTEPSVVRIEISWKTIIKVLLGIVLAFVVLRVWLLLKLLFVASLLAVPLYRLVLWGCRRNWPRWAGLVLASFTLIFTVLGLAALVGPMAINQASEVGHRLPELKQQFLEHIPVVPLRKAAESALDFDATGSFQRSSQQAFAAAKATVGGLLQVVLVIVLAIYLMVDGSRALQWLIAYFPQGQRRRVAEGLEKIGDRMVAFIVGQAILSGLFAGYVLVVLSVLQVPMALLLAVLAGFLDVVPVIGISVSLVLGATMGMTVSPTTALLVVGCYGGYHLFESYFLMPKVYGKKLRLSTLAVLVFMISGGMVAGVVGAVGILPLVAAYPALESLWLAPQLEPDVVKDHQKQLRAA